MPLFKSLTHRGTQQDPHHDDETAVSTRVPKPNEEGNMNQEEATHGDEALFNEEHTVQEEEASVKDEEESIADEESSKTSDLDKIIRHLQTEDWSFSVKREKQVIITSATGDNGTYRIIIDLKADEKIVIVYVYLPCKAPTEKRLAVAEYTTRANYGLVIGNFEMDFQDGEVRYKGALEYADGELTNGMIEQLLQKSAYTMNRYFRGLMRVIYGDVEALDAIREIEPQQAGGAALALARLVEALAVNTSDHSEASSEAVALAVNTSDHSEASSEAVAMAVDTTSDHSEESSQAVVISPAEE